MKGIVKKMLCATLSATMMLALGACGASNTDGGDAASSAPAATESSAGESVASGEKTVLNMWHIWAAESESSKKPFEDAVAKFNSENDRNIEIVLDATENETYKQKMVTTIAANEAPDIYFYWSGGYMQNIVEAGKVLALDDYLTDDIKSQLMDGALDNMTFGGKIYGMGYSQSVGTFFINTELFDQYGVKVPETYDELVTAVKTFRDNGVSTPIAVGAKEAWCIDMYLDMLETREAGAETCIAALSKKGSFEDAGIIEGARKLQELVDMGAFGDGALAISRDESEVPFYNGQVPMYFNGSWTIGNINRDDCKVKGKIDIVKFPTLSAKSNVNDFTGGAAECFLVNASTKYPEECVYALSQILPDFAKNLYESGAGLPTWKVNADESKIDDLTKKLVELTSNASSYTLWWNTYLTGEDSETYMRLSQQLFAKEITPEEYAKAMQSMNE